MLRTQFLSRNVVCVKPMLLGASILLLSTACSRLPALTPEILSEAQQKWTAHKPASYRLVIEMSGDRVQAGRFEVDVREGQVVSFRRNGLIISPNPGQDYTMDGLFHMLAQELGLAEKPTMLGAPPGYSVYMNARFDEDTGRLIRYRRIVGGTSNSIDVHVTEWRPGI
jgi:Family of unknown function (DUF6174)